MTSIGLDLRFWRQETGGLGRYSRNLLRELLTLDEETKYTAIITPDDEAEFNLSAPNLKKMVVDIPHYSPAEQTKLSGILKRQNFDLVHFANFNHSLLYRRPFVVTVHDLIMHLYPGGAQKSSRLRRLAYKLVISDCRRAKKIIVPSRSTRDDLAKMLKFPYHKIVITPEGAEKSFFPADRGLIATLKTKLKLPERYLLFVSRWEEYKGLRQLVQAHQLLQKDFPDLGLVITGKPSRQNPELGEFVKQAQEAGQKIITPGFVRDEELAPLYSGAAAYVHPSLYEGFGIMVLEAMACAVPVITSNTSSLPEVVGGAGVLVDPTDVSALSAAIKRVLSDEDLRQNLKEKGLERAKQFSWRKMAKQTLEIYRQALP